MLHYYCRTYSSRLLTLPFTEHANWVTNTTNQKFFFLPLPVVMNGGVDNWGIADEGAMIDSKGHLLEPYEDDLLKYEPDELEKVEPGEVVWCHGHEGY